MQPEPSRCRVTSLAYVDQRAVDPAFRELVPPGMPCYLARWVDKISSKGRRQRRILLLTYQRLVLLEQPGHVKRYVPLRRVRQLLLQTVTETSGKSHQVLVKIPQEYDILLEFVDPHDPRKSEDLRLEFVQVMNRIRTVQTSSQAQIVGASHPGMGEWAGVSEFKESVQSHLFYREAKLDVAVAARAGYVSPRDKIRARRADLARDPNSPMSPRSRSAGASAFAPDAAFQRLGPPRELDVVSDAASPTLGRMGAGAVVVDGADEEQHDLVHTTGRPEGATGPIECQRCAKPGLESEPEGYIKCRTCVDVFCCDQCWTQIDASVEKKMRENLHLPPAFGSPKAAAKAAAVGEQQPPSGKEEQPATSADGATPPNESVSARDSVSARAAQPRSLPDTPAKQVQLPPEPDRPDAPVSATVVDRLFQRDADAPLSVDESQSLRERLAEAVRRAERAESELASMRMAAASQRSPYPASSRGMPPPSDATDDKPPASWVYAAVPNPNPETSHRSSVVYKRRMLSVWTSSQGKALSVSSRSGLTSGRADSIPLSEILEVGAGGDRAGDVAGQQNLASLGVAFYVTTASRKLCFVSTSRAERDHWVSWLHDALPGSVPRHC
eukprot:TRINITY_DN30528_c0_g1_i1.p1 TRINITY_DN30528_c0_g1~~TRINITY_DN30528_c0_g1_i1.p1  ORF type:complete len:613 (+),score=165.01 TRINITY_DN30528_c0_g1_i1:56-1894(+)